MGKDNVFDSYIILLIEPRAALWRNRIAITTIRRYMPERLYVKCRVFGFWLGDFGHFFA